MITLLTFIVAVPTVFFATPFFSHGWRSLFFVYLLAGAIFLYVFGEFWRIEAQHGSDRDLRWFVSKGFWGFVAICFGASVLPRTVLIWQWERGKDGTLGRALHWLGALSVAALIAVPFFLNQYAKRSPPLACLEQPIPIEIAGAELELPFAPLYFEPWRDLGSPGLGSAEGRVLCEKTVNGTQRVTFEAVAIRFSQRAHFADWCAGIDTTWARAACDPKRKSRELPNGITYYDPSVDFPAYKRRRDTWQLFRNARDEGRLSDSKVMLDIASEAGFIVSPNLKTPGGDPLVAYCSDFSGAIGSDCYVDYAWDNTLRINWHFRIKRETAHLTFKKMTEIVPEIIPYFLVKN